MKKNTIIILLAGLVFVLTGCNHTTETPEVLETPAAPEAPETSGTPEISQGAKYADTGGKGSFSEEGLDCNKNFVYSGSVFIDYPNTDYCDAPGGPNFGLPIGEDIADNLCQNNEDFLKKDFERVYDSFDCPTKCLEKSFVDFTTTSLCTKVRPGTYVQPPHDYPGSYITCLGAADVWCKEKESKASPQEPTPPRTPEVSGGSPEPLPPEPPTPSPQPPQDDPEPRPILCDPPCEPDEFCKGWQDFDQDTERSFTRYECHLKECPEYENDVNCNYKCKDNTRCKYDKASTDRLVPDPRFKCYGCVATCPVGEFGHHDECWTACGNKEIIEYVSANGDYCCKCGEPGTQRQPRHSDDEEDGDGGTIIIEQPMEPAPGGQPEQPEEPECGDGTCNSDTGEDCDTCLADCGCPDEQTCQSGECAEPIPTVCVTTDFSCSSWSPDPCPESGQQTRTCPKKSDVSCAGGITLDTSRSCTPPEPCDIGILTVCKQGYADEYMVCLGACLTVPCGEGCLETDPDCANLCMSILTDGMDVCLETDPSCTDNDFADIQIDWE